jgi:hypothetical protein
MMNLGSEVGLVNATDTGFLVSYVKGDECNYNKDRFSSEIEFVCDKTEGDGLPVLIEEDETGCVFRFVWRTQFACDVCTNEEMSRIEGSCSDGSRKISLAASDHCINIDGNRVQHFVEECSMIKELVKTWPVVIGLIIFVCLLILTLGFLFCFCRMKHRYQLLLEADHMAIEQDENEIL